MQCSSRLAVFVFGAALSGCGSDELPTPEPAEEEHELALLAPEQEAPLQLEVHAIDLPAVEVAERLDRSLSGVRVLTSRAQYRALYGRDPTAIDFRREWAVAYAAGPRRSGGYRARVVRVASARGVLVIVTELEAPGPGCTASGGRASPQVLVRFPRPWPRPAWASITQRGATRVCEPALPPGCAGFRCVDLEHCELGPGGPTCVSDVQPSLCATVLCPADRRCVGTAVHAACIPPDRCHRDADCPPGQRCGPAHPCTDSPCVAPLACVADST